VECKNWNSNTPVSEVQSFTQKATQVGVKLAFFVSVSGFTDTAKASLQLTSVNPHLPLIVPISGDQIKDALGRNTDLEEFFKERIRDIKYLRKY
jgi:restriction endonuclease Mrr